jgi:hypothetical protein
MPEWKDFYCRLLEFGYVFNNHAVENLVTLECQTTVRFAAEPKARI